MIFRDERKEGFALTSSLEEDTRALVVESVNEVHEYNLWPKLFNKTLLDNCVARAQRDNHSIDIKDPDYEMALHFSDLGDLVPMLNRISKINSISKSNNIKKLSRIIEPVIPVRNRIFHSRPMEPGDFSFACATATNAVGLFKSHNKTMGTLKSLRDDPERFNVLSIPDYWKVGDTSCQHNLPIPDYELTGFIGRNGDLKKLKKHVLEGHNVISIIGQGGLGKTAIALKLAYSILDSDDNPFEIIIWTSLKTHSLLPNSIKLIEDAISETPALLRTISHHLGIPLRDLEDLDKDLLLDEINESIKAFKVLLIIDNLETIKAGELIDYLERFQGGSKVLITSRRGIGELERVFPLNKLSKTDSLNLFKSTASVFNQDALANLSPSDLEARVHALHYNPLAIKWYVGAVSEGGDPQRLLRSNNQHELLTFCFDNIFSGIPKNARKVLNVLYCARRKISGAELHYCLIDDERDVPSYWNEIRLLRNLNVIETEEEKDFISYQLTEFCRSYIKELNQVPSKMVKSISSSLSTIRAAREETRKQIKIHYYNYSFVEWKNPEQEFVSSILIKAVEERDFDKALLFCNTAIKLAPSFSEAYRIKAQILLNEDLDAAQEAFEAGVEVDPYNSRLRYLFAMFLYKKLFDAHSALEQISLAYKYAKRSKVSDNSIRNTYAWILVRNSQLDEAKEIYEKEIIPQFGSVKAKEGTMTMTQAAECYRRLAENSRTVNDTISAFRYLCRGMELLSLPKKRGDWDEGLDKVFNKLIKETLGIEWRLKPEEKELYQTIVNDIKPLYTIAYRYNRPVRTGKIEFIARPDGRFGFIVDDETGARLYFATSLKFRDGKDYQGYAVFFVIGSNKEGDCAEDVTLIEEASCD